MPGYIFAILGLGIFGLWLAVYLCYQSFQFRVHNRELPDLFQPFSGFPFGQQKIAFEMLFVKFEPEMSVLLRTLLIVHRILWVGIIVGGVILLFSLK